MEMRHLIIGLTIAILASIVTPIIAVEVLAIDLLDTGVQPTSSTLTCSQPATSNAEFCRQVEAEILASTVQIRIESWTVKEGESGYDYDFSTGHATLIADRYLVTHNHFGVPLSFKPQEADTEPYLAVTLANGNGQPLFTGSLYEFELVWEDSESLVLGSKDQELFRKLGFQSATWHAWTSVPLEPGQEVAQVDWDGVTTRVDWTTIQEVHREEGVPQLLLADDVSLGASGGGIFWRGIHVANNWLRVQQFDASGNLISAHTKAALNGPTFHDLATAQLPAAPAN